MFPCHLPEIPNLSDNTLQVDIQMQFWQSIEKYNLHKTEYYCSTVKRKHSQDYHWIVRNFFSLWFQRWTLHNVHIMLTFDSTTPIYKILLQKMSNKQSHHKIIIHTGCLYFIKVLACQYLQWLQTCILHRHQYSFGRISLCQWHFYGK